MPGGAWLRDHLLRSIDRFVDLTNIRSEQWLCEKVHLNLAYRCFCWFDRGGPDEHTSCTSFPVRFGILFW